MWLKARTLATLEGRLPDALHRRRRVQDAGVPAVDGRDRGRRRRTAAGRSTSATPKRQAAPVGDRHGLVGSSGFAPRGRPPCPAGTGCAARFTRVPGARRHGSSAARRVGRVAASAARRVAPQRGHVRGGAGDWGRDRSPRRPHRRPIERGARAIRALLYDVFDDMTEPDYEHCLGGVHARAVRTGAGRPRQSWSSAACCSRDGRYVPATSKVSPSGRPTGGGASAQR